MISFLCIIGYIVGGIVSSSVAYYKLLQYREQCYHCRTTYSCLDHDGSIVLMTFLFWPIVDITFTLKHIIHKKFTADAAMRQIKHAHEKELEQIMESL